MDELEFRRLLDLFPIVRSRDYHAESESSKLSTSLSQEHGLKEWHDARDEGGDKEVMTRGGYHQDAFWEKLKSSAERKMDKAAAERLCKAFQQIHEKLVNEELNLDVARRFV